MISSGWSGAPSAFAWARARPLNALEHTLMPNAPRRPIETESWTLHDAQDPQSPEPLITTMLSDAIRSSNEGSAPIDAFGLRWRTTFATPYRASSSCSRSSASSEKLGLELSMKPTVAPAREPVIRVAEDGMDARRGATGSTTAIVAEPLSVALRSFVVRSFVLLSFVLLSFVLLSVTTDIGFPSGKQVMRRSVQDALMIRTLS